MAKVRGQTAGAGAAETEAQGERKAEAEAKTEADWAQAAAAGGDPRTAARTTLVTGASSGFGLLIAVELARRGCRVVAGMRNPVAGREALMREAARAGIAETDAAGGTGAGAESGPQSGATAGAAGIEVVALDVTDTASIEAALSGMRRKYGRIDVLVNNAGLAVGGFVEEVPMEAWRAQMETNFFGVVAMTRAVLPVMRAQGGGTIIQMSSVSGRWGFPGYGAYAASKYAIEGFSESVRHEVAPHGIRVALVEPGAYRTAIWTKGIAGMHAKPDSPYRATLEAILGFARRAAETSPDPREVASLVGRLADRRRLTKLRYPIGRGSRLLLAGQLLPWRIIEAAVRRALGKK